MKHIYILVVLLLFITGCQQEQSIANYYATKETKDKVTALVMKYEAVAKRDSEMFRKKHTTKMLIDEMKERNREYAEIKEEIEHVQRYGTLNDAFDLHMETFKLLLDASIVDNETYMKLVDAKESGTFKDRHAKYKMYKRLKHTQVDKLARTKKVQSLQKFIERGLE